MTLPENQLEIIRNCSKDEESFQQLVHLLEGCSSKAESKETLVESDALYRVVGEHMPGSIFAFDRELRYVLAAGQGITGAGLSPEFFMGKRLRDVSPPEIYTRDEPALIAALNGQTTTSELEYGGKNYVVHTLPIRNTLGEIVGGMVSSQDITERKTLEDALRQSEYRLKTITENLQDAVFLYDMNGKVQFVSPAFDELTGYSGAELYQQHHFQYVHPEDVACMEGYKDSAFNGTSITDEEFRIITKELQIKWCACSWKPVYDQSEVQIGILGRYTDITERRLAEEELRTSNHLIERIMAISPNIAYVYDLAENRAILVSNAFYRVLGYTPEQMQSMRDQFMEHLLHPDDFAQMPALAASIRAAKDGDVIQANVRAQDANGVYRWFDFRATVFGRDENGVPNQLLGLAMDISQRKKIEEAARQNEEYYRILARSLPNSAVIMFDHDLRHLIVEGEILKRHGLAKQGYKGKKAQEVVPPEYLEVIPNIYRDTLAGKASEYVFSREGYTYFARYVPMRGDDNNIVAGLCVIEDITDRKQVEDALRESNRRFDELVANIPGMVYRVRRTPDHQLFFDYISPRCRELNGVEAEVLKKNIQLFFDHLHPDEVKNFMRALDRSEQSGRPFFWEGHLVLDGKLVWRRLESFPRKLEDGSVIWDGIETDTTARNLAEATLQESEERFKGAFENSPIGMVLVSPGGQYLKVNRRIAEMMGYTETELLELDFQSVTYPDDLPREREQDRKLLRGEIDSYSVEKRYVHKEGYLVWGLMSASLVKDPNGDPNYFIAQVQDITQRKMAEAQMEQLVRELERTNQELTDFVYVVSHDLKAPLRGISTLAEWLVKDYSDCIDDKGREMLDLMRGRAGRMSTLIDAVLRYSRVGRANEEKTHVDLNLLVSEVTKMLAPAPNIQVALANPLPLLWCERAPVEQVFSNLISNAMKFMDKPSGKIVIDARYETNRWLFSVADNGPGIEKRHFVKIFQIFQTLQPRDELETTGIGLSIVKKVVELYGGRVWVESVVGEGTTFYFTLPTAMVKQSERRPTDSSR